MQATIKTESPQSVAAAPSAPIVPPPNKRPRTHDDDINTDMNCMVCRGLVDDAVQTTCCGSPWCRTCVTRAVTLLSACPACRAPKGTFDIVLDARNERRSKEAIRSCEFKMRGCEFVGDRDSVKRHMECCQHGHDVVLQRKVKALEAQLAEAQRQRDGQSELVQMVNEIVRDALESRGQNDFLMETVLRRANRCIISKIMKMDDHSEHAIRFRKGRATYKAVMYCHNNGVGAFLYREGRAPADVTAKVRLLHPSDPTQDEAFSFKDWPYNANNWGNRMVFSNDVIRRFSINGKFVIAFQ